MPRVPAILPLVTAVALTTAAAAGTPGPPAPYRDAGRQPRGYAGPGREEPEPVGLTEVRIGWFGPSDPEDPLDGGSWRAAGLAIERANAGGGYRGLPFRLVPAWSENPWGSGIARVVRMAYEDGIWALLGSIDGASSHLAEQVVAKARLTLLSPGGTDASVNMANVAWAFTCMPPDDRLAEVLAGRIVSDGPPRRLALLFATDHDSRRTADACHLALRRAGVGPALVLAVDPADPDIDAIVARLGTGETDAVLLLAGARTGARLVRALRAALGPVPLYGGPAMERRLFLEEAGAAADGMVVPMLCEPSWSGSDFAATFRARSGTEPDCAAAQSYDAVLLIVDAIRSAGLNRARIRDTVEAVTPWRGVSGIVSWNALGQNERLPGVGVVRGGRVASSTPARTSISSAPVSK